MVQLILENASDIDVVKDGRVPKSTGMRNDSEESEAQNIEPSDKFKNVKCRSLILFFALEQDSYEILEYLWKLETVQNWGNKNLEFLLMNVNAIQGVNDDKALQYF